MFDALSGRFDDIFRRLRGRGRLSEKDVDAVLREIRLALLEADVSLRVVKAFIADVKERAAGAEINKSLTPAQQVIKIVHHALVDIMGSSAATLETSPQLPRTILIAGLQGSGKTAVAARVAAYLKGQGRRALLGACDLRRPAAIRQLELLGEKAGVPVHAEPQEKKAEKVGKRALLRARDEGFTDLVVDTSGRMHVVPELMAELARVARAIEPAETLLVCDAMMGQDAVNVAEAFVAEVDVTGIVLTKLDGDARGGAALSMAYTTGRPVKFAGVGEKVSDLEVFYPDRVASRILGMGDVMTLIEKAESAFDEAEAKKMEDKLRKASFSFDDFLAQLHSLKRMGPLSQVLGMLPGMGKLPLDDAQIDSQLPKIEAIIHSMTKGERANPQIIRGSRRTRIARGSGTTIQDVNRLLKQFDEVRKLVKGMVGGGRRTRLPAGLKLPPGFGP